MSNKVEFEIRANMDKWRREMSDLIEIAFLRSDNIDQFVRYADEALKEKFGMPYSLSLETLYYSLRTIWELKADNARENVEK